MAGRVGPLTRSARCDGQGKTATRWDNRGFSPLPVEARVTSLTIEPIEETMWSGIQRVQSEVYLDVEPESTEILRSKWLHSPACCFAMRKGDEVLAYLLAHAWDSIHPPKLHQPLPAESQGQGLFLHDIAVSRKLTGVGAGTQLVKQLLETAGKLGYRHIRLVAVQGSSAFWKKLGFEAVPGLKASACYGSDATVMQQTLA